MNEKDANDGKVKLQGFLKRDAYTAANNEDKINNTEEMSLERIKEVIDENANAKQETDKCKMYKKINCKGENRIEDLIK